MNAHDESVLRAAFAPARALEPSDADVDAVLGRLGDRASGRRRAIRSGMRRLAPIAAALALLLVGGYAVAEPVRAALDDIAGTFGDWLGGDDAEAPGRPVDAGDAAPPWIADGHFADEPRVIAEAGGYKLFAARRGGGIELDLGDTGVGLGMPSAESFRGRPLMVLGPGAMRNMDLEHHVPLFGLVARSVTRVELTYATGPPLRVDDVEGAFVLLAEPERSPQAVVAYDATGREVARDRVDEGDHVGVGIDWSQYGPPAPVIPSRCEEGVPGPKPPGCPNG